MLLKIVIGLIGIAIGTYMVMRTESMVSAFGRIDFFDKYLGTDGGTRLGYKIIGMLVIFISVLIATNMIGGFMTWLLAPLLKFNQPPK